MAKIKISQVTALPGTLSPNTLYMVSVSASKMECYMTGNVATTVKRIINEADVQALISSAMASIGEIEVVADIAARNALNPTRNMQALVLNATGDGTVASGAATYVYRLSNTTWYKISEAESMDFAIAWASITGKPSSSPAAIDSAVSNSHTHSNKTQLDLIGQDGDGDITYNGVKVANEYGATAW